MRIISLFLTAILSSTVFLSSAQHFKKASDYLIFIDRNQKEIVLDIISYTTELTHSKNVRNEQLHRKKIMQRLQSTSVHIGGMPAFKNERSLQDSFVVYAQSAYKVFENEFSQVEKLQDSASKSYDVAVKFVKTKEEALTKLLKEDADFDRAVKLFADKNSVTVPKNFEDQYADLLAVKNTDKHLNTLFLAFFKCNRQEDVLAKAINTKKKEEIETANATLSNYIKEGLAIADTVQPYKEYSELILATKEILNAYKTESETKVPALVSSLATNENTGPASYAGLKAEIDLVRTTLVPKWNKASHKFLFKFLPI